MPLGSSRTQDAASHVWFFDRLASVSSGGETARGFLTMVVLVVVMAFNLLARCFPRTVGRLYAVVSSIPFLLFSRLFCEVCNVIGFLLGVPLQTRQSCSTFVLCSCLAWWAKTLPTVSGSMDEASKRIWSQTSTTEPAVVLVNHTSFMDAVLLAWFAPYAYRSNIRIMYMAKMGRWPIIGRSLRLAGHFPVFFKKYGDGLFSLDASQQRDVQSQVEEYLKPPRNGRVLLFPEGRINQHPREQGLLPFRHGTFKMLVDMRLPVYFLTITGSDDAWPTTAAVGGFPAQICMKFSRFETRYGQDESIEDMAIRARSEMQAQLTRHVVSDDPTRK